MSHVIHSPSYVYGTTSYLPMSTSGSSTPTATAAAAAVERILQVIQIVCNQAALTPGFTHALRLSYNLISKQHLTWNDDDDDDNNVARTLTYRYKFGKQVGKPTAGLLLAIMDEISTSACFGAGNPSAPGVSIQMHLELCQQRGLRHHHPMLVQLPSVLQQQQQQYEEEELDVISTVVKLGRILSYITTEFRNPNTRALVAFGSHTKYMPLTGISLLLPSSTASSSLTPPPQHIHQYKEKYLVEEVIAPNLVHNGIGRATFHMNHDHVNGFGSLHVSS